MNESNKILFRYYFVRLSNSQSSNLLNTARLRILKSREDHVTASTRPTVAATLPCDAFLTYAKENDMLFCLSVFSGLSISVKAGMENWFEKARF